MVYRPHGRNILSSERPSFFLSELQNVRSAEWTLRPELELYWRLAEWPKVLSTELNPDRYDSRPAECPNANPMNVRLSALPHSQLADSSILRSLQPYLIAEKPSGKMSNPPNGTEIHLLANPLNGRIVNSINNWLSGLTNSQMTAWPNGRSDYNIIADWPNVFSAESNSDLFNCRFRQINESLIHKMTDYLICRIAEFLIRRMNDPFSVQPFCRLVEWPNLLSTK